LYNGKRRRVSKKKKCIKVVVAFKCRGHNAVLWAGLDRKNLDFFFSLTGNPGKGGDEGTKHGARQKNNRDTILRRRKQSAVGCKGWLYRFCSNRKGGDQIKASRSLARKNSGMQDEGGGGSGTVHKRQRGHRRERGGKVRDGVSEGGFQGSGKDIKKEGVGGEPAINYSSS